MKGPLFIPLLAAGFLLVGCSDTPPTAPAGDAASTSPSLDEPAFAAGGAIMTPISFVATFTDVCAIPGYPGSFRPHGSSGRAKLRFALGFDITGGMVGTSCVFIDANLTSEFGPQDFFTTRSFTVTEACIPSRGICGTWEDRLPGKINVDPNIGVESPSHGVMQGVAGDALGTKILIESFVECDPPGAGCGEGVLLEPGG